MSTKQLLKLCSAPKKAAPKRKISSAPARVAAPAPAAPPTQPAPARAKLEQILTRFLETGNAYSMLKYRSDSSVWAQVSDFLTLNDRQRREFAAKFCKSGASFERVFATMHKTSKVDAQDMGGYDDMEDEQDVDDDAVKDENVDECEDDQEPPEIVSDEDEQVAAPTNSPARNRHERPPTRQLDLAATLARLRLNRPTQRTTQFLGPAKKEGSRVQSSVTPEPVLRFWKKPKLSAEHDKIVAFMIEEECRKCGKVDWIAQLSGAQMPLDKALRTISGISRVATLSELDTFDSVCPAHAENYKYLASRF